MAHGAPDHTRLADNAYAHYRDKWSYFALAGLAAGDPANYIVNVNIVGTLGEIYVWSTNPQVELRIVVDGVSVYSWDVATLVTLGLWSFNNPLFKMHCTKYDAITDQYAMLFSGNNEIYVHKSLAAWLVRNAPGDNAYAACWYKEKI